MENSNPKISVIVPIYNAEKFLHRCIDSILAQSFTDFELLLIDDGSNDNSGKICDDYAQKDNRIKVFHKKNGGVSSARNIGLENAIGEWIAFCDADDWYCSNTFNMAFSLFDKNKVDIIEIPYSRDGKFHVHKELLINGKKEIDKYYANNFRNELWGRFFSKRLICDKRFMTSLKIGEDVVFFISCYTDINTLYTSSQGGYIYFRNNSSVMVTSECKLEQEQVEKYLAIISQMSIPIKRIIGFYFNTTYYIWSIRHKIKIKNINIINQISIFSILSSKLTLKKKVKFIFLKFNIHYYIQKKYPLS